MSYVLQKVPNDPFDLTAGHKFIHSAKEINSLIFRAYIELLTAGWRDKILRIVAQLNIIETRGTVNSKDINIIMLMNSKASCILYSLL